MYDTGTIMLMVCESPLHAGTGSDLDYIDKPIQRERHTGFPKVESSSLKGALRERISTTFPLKNNAPEMNAAFGPFDPATGDERQGALGFGDARLLLFPVKSAKGVFAWVTCPRVLERFEQDLRRFDGHEDFVITGVPEFDPTTDRVQALFFHENLVIQGGVQGSAIVLEDYDFQPIYAQDVKAGKTPLNEWLADQVFPTSSYPFWNGLLKQNLVIIPDDDFADFVEFTTEILTRNKIDPNTGTVAKGHLFSEEYLPADSVLYSFVLAHAEFRENGRPANDILKIFTQGLVSDCNSTFQAGGNASIGKGLIRAVLLDNSSQTPQSA